MRSACGIPTHILDLDPPAEQGGAGPQESPAKSAAPATFAAEATFAAPAKFAALRNRDCRPYLFGAGLAMMADNIEHVITTGCCGRSSTRRPWPASR